MLRGTGRAPRRAPEHVIGLGAPRGR